MAKTDDLIIKAQSLLDDLKYHEVIDLLPDKILNKHNNGELYSCRAWAHYQLNEHEIATKYKDKALKAEPDLLNKLNQKGIDWFNMGENDKAIIEYDKALMVDENFATAIYNKGLALYEKGDYENAISYYDKAISLDTDYSYAFIGRGLAWYYKKEYDKAIEDFDKAINLQSDYTDAYLNRGLAWHYKGEYNKAIADYDKAIVLKPDYTNAYINRGIAYYYKGEYNESIADYTRAINLNDKLEYAYNNRGLAYYNKGFYIEAIDDYNKALDLKPDYHDAFNNRGMAWYEKGEYDKAIEDCTKTIEISPNYVDAYNIRGNAWYFKEDFVQAEENFWIVASYKGYEALGYSNLGDVYSSLGEFQKAQEFYEKANSFDNIQDWLSKQILQKLERNKQRINLVRSNVKLVDLIMNTKIEDRIDRTLQNIRKVAKSDAKSVVHYTKLFVADIYVSSLNSKMHYSNAIYMNDPMEGKVFFEYLKDWKDDSIIQAYLNGEKRNESSVYLGSFLPAKGSGYSKSHEDELVMWRTYGKDKNGKEAAGCNLVLSSEFFKLRKKPAATAHLNSGAENDMQKVAIIKEEYSKNKTGDEELLDVIYVEIHNEDKSIKNDTTGNIKPALEELKRLLNSFIELRDKHDKQSDFYKHIENTIFKQLSTISFLFKSADYIFENEVRVIEYVPRNSDEIKFMKIDEPNFPGKRFYIESNNEILPFVRKIYLGPKVENHQQWSLYFDFEIRQRAKEIANIDSPSFELKPSDIEILKSECKFQ